MSGDQIDYKGVLADLKARREALDHAIMAIEAIVVGEPVAVSLSSLNGGGSSGTREIEPGTFFSLNTVEATKKWLGLVGKAQSTKQIGEALRKGSLEVKDNSVAAILQRTVRAGDPDLVNVSRGMWGLKKFYGR